MPFVVPVKAMALTVSTVMCGTMFTRCVHERSAPLCRAHNLKYVEKAPGNFLSRVVVSIVAADGAPPADASFRRRGSSGGRAP